MTEDCKNCGFNEKEKCALNLKYYPEHGKYCGHWEKPITDEEWEDILQMIEELPDDL